MIKLLETRREISKAQSTLEKSLLRHFTTPKRKNIGYPGGTSYDKKIGTDGRYWYLRGTTDKPNQKNPRHLNWFGLYREELNLQITVEINILRAGTTQAIAGFFGCDIKTGQVYLCHSGGIGGGTAGVSKAAFLAWSSQNLVEVIESSGRTRMGTIVAPIDGPNVARSVLRYVQSIAEFKEAVRAGEISTREFQDQVKKYRDFYEESRGRRKGLRRAEIDYISRHGDIVKALYDWLLRGELPKSHRVVKNALIDLGVKKNNQIIEIYEVKTSASRQNIYTAIGQLTVHASSHDCERTIVLPKDSHIAKDLANALKRNQIGIVYFELTKNFARIV